MTVYMLWIDLGSLYMLATCIFHFPHDRVKKGSLLCRTNVDSGVS